MQDGTLCPGLVSIPAGVTPSLSLRPPGEARQVPEAAGGRDRADPTGQETPGDDELVGVPFSPSLHHLHLISETFTGWIWLDIGIGLAFFVCVRFKTQRKNLLAPLCQKDLSAVEMA